MSGLCPPIWLTTPQSILGFVSLNGDIFPFILLAYQLAHYAKPLYCAAFIPQWWLFGFHFTKGERRCIVWSESHRSVVFVFRESIPLMYFPYCFRISFCTPSYFPAREYSRCRCVVCHSCRSCPTNFSPVQIFWAFSSLAPLSNKMKKQSPSILYAKAYQFSSKVKGNCEVLFAP